MPQTARMSLTRRRLGTGPSTSPTTPAAVESAARLLPVERIDRTAGRDVDHGQDVPGDRPGRRLLGEGPGQ